MKDAIKQLTKLSKVSKKKRLQIRSIATAFFAFLFIGTGLWLVLSRGVQAAPLVLTTSSNTVQIDVANRYRAIMTTDDTEDYILLYDRAEDDSTPDAVYEFFGAGAIDETNQHHLRYHDTRTTTILEATNTRIRVRVEGCLDTSAGGACLLDVDNGNDDTVQVIEEYTFTADSVYLNTQFDFRDGLGLDGTGGSDRVRTFVTQFNQSVSTAHSETILYGDGETEATSTGDEDIDANNDIYVVAQGTGSYQDIIFGTMNLNEDRHLSTSSNGQNYYNLDADGGEQDLIQMQEINNQTMKGKGSGHFFVSLQAQADLDTEIEREGFFNSLTNPDQLGYSTGSEWQDSPVVGLNSGMEFDGTEGRVDAGTAATAVTAMTIEAWIKVDSSSSGTNKIAAACYNCGGGGGPFALGVNSGNSVALWLQDDTGDTRGSVGGSTNVRDDEWHHVAGTYDGTTARIFIDGVEENTDSSTWSGNLEGSNDDLVIGADNGNQFYFDGVIDEVRYYDTALTEATIQDRMFRKLTGEESNLLGYWDFDHQTGQTITDRSGNSNDATVGATAATASDDPSWVVVDRDGEFTKNDSSYNVDLNNNQAGEVDLDGAIESVSTLVNESGLDAGDTSFTVDSTTGFPSSGVAYVEGDKFSYTGTTATTFTGIPSSGDLAVIDHEDNSVVSTQQRTAPSYKLRNYRDSVPPSTVQYEGTEISRGTDYNADLKPVSHAVWSQDLLWHSTLEDTTSVTSPDVGSAGSEGSSTTYANGKYGNGIEINASDEYVAMPLSGNFDPTTGTVEFWYRNIATVSAYHRFFESTEGSSEVLLQRNNSDTSYNFVMNSADTTATWSSATSVYDGEWHHIRLTYDTDADQFILYIDGVSQGTQNVTQSDATISSYELEIGGDGGDNAQGIIDEFRTYDTVLGPEQIAYGGNTGESNEYLADDTTNQTLSFSAVDASNRGEYLHIGSDSQFQGLNIGLATDGIRTEGSPPVITWEYWNGSQWTGLAVSSDTAGASNLTASGSMFWAAPSGWMPYSVNGSTDLYFIRGYLSSGSYATSPVESTIKTDILTLQYLSNVTNEDQTLTIPGTNEPSAIWHFDENADNTCNGGEDACDATGNGNDGTFSSAPAWTDISVSGGSALNFDGTDDYLTVTDSNGLDPTNSGTLEAWIRPHDVSSAESSFGSWTTLTAPDGAGTNDHNDGVDFTVVGDRIYYANYMHNTTTEVFQTAYSDLDGTNFSGWTSQTAPDGAGEQETTSVAVDSDGVSLYYAAFSHSSTTENFYTASSDLDGTNFSSWTSHTAPDGAGTNDDQGIDMVIVGSNMYFGAYLHEDETLAFLTANVNLDGTGFSGWTTQTDPTGHATDNGNSTSVGLASDGDKIYYAAFTHESTPSGDEPEYLSIANSDLDGTDFSTWTALTGPTYTDSNTNSSGFDMTMIGDKLYYVAFVQNNANDETFQTSRSDLDGSNQSAWTEQTNPDGAGTSVSPSIESDGKSIYYSAFAQDGVTELLKVASSTVTSHPIISKLDSYELIQTGGGFMFDWGGSPKPFGTVSANEWSHVAVTNDGSSMNYFVDGQLVRTQSTTNDFTLTSSSLLLGGDATTYFDGEIDEVKVYPYARTAGEIRQSYLTGGNASGATVSIGGSIESDGTLSDGLVGWWKMNESSANTCTGGTNDTCDSSGNGNDGAWTGAVNETGRFGQGVTFDGVDDYITITDPSDGSLDFGTTSFSYCLWVNDAASVGTFDMPLHKGGDQAGAPGYDIELGTGNWSASVADSTSTYIVDFDFESSLLNNWYHLCAVVDRSTNTMTGYVDGRIRGSSATTDVTNLGNVDNSEPLVFGTDEVQNNDFSGVLDEVRIYNRALTQKEVEVLAKWAPGPVVHIPLDENEGTSTVYDLGSGNVGTIAGSMTDSDWVGGKFGSALEFDGTDDTIDFGNVAETNPGTGDFSVMGWIKMPSSASTDRSVFSKQETTFTDGWNVWIDGDTTAGGIEINVDDGSNSGKITGSQDLRDNTWHHIAFTVTGDDRTDWKLYVDGVEDSITEGGTDLASGGITTTDDLRVAARGNGASNLFQGSIDELKYYNYVRTPSQIVEDMNAGHPVGGSPVGSQVGYWKFDEGYGDTVYDHSPQGNNGDLAGSGVTCPTTGACPTQSNNGKNGKTLDFDGTDDYVSVSADSSFDLNNQTEYSICAWLNPDSDGENDTGEIFSKGNTYIRTGFESGGQVNISANIDLATTDASYTSSNTIPVDEWSHVCVVWEDDTSDELLMYINGQFDGTSSGGAGSTADDSASDLEIGGDSSNNFDGEIDDLKIYAAVLTQSQVFIEYNLGRSTTLGATSTTSTGSADSSASREYCVPGDSSTCNAPVGHWKLDEKADNTCSASADACDISGNEFHATHSGSPVWRSAGKCHEGACLELDGGSAYTTYDDTGASALDRAGDWTIQAWVNFNQLNTTFTPLVYKGSVDVNSANYVFQTRSSPNQDEIRCQYRASGGTWYTLDSVSADLTTNQWYHIACAFDDTANSLTLYVDGVENNTSTSATETPGTGNADLFIGRGDSGGGGDNLDGWIDDVRVYDYARTPAQIAWDINQGAPIAHWKLNECSGSTVYDYSLNANDEARGNNGTITIGASGTNTSVGTCSSGDSAEAWNNGTNGKYDASMDFDGNDDFIEVSDVAILDFADGEDFSISAWINIDVSTVDQAVVSKKTSQSASDDGYMLFFNDPSDIIDFRVSDGTDQFIISSNVISTGSWQHVVAVFDESSATTSTIYINGKDAKASTTGNIANVDSIENALGLRIGTQNNGSSDYDGQIDDVKIFNYALTQDQIEVLFNNAAVKFGQ